MKHAKTTISAASAPLGAGDTDEQLASRACGCRESFGELARRFQVRLLRFLQRRTRSTADAEDLLQETLVRAYQRLDRYDESRPFGTWLFTIAHRLAVSHHRRAMAIARASAGYALRDGTMDRSKTDPGRRIADDESRRRFWDTAADVLTHEQLSATWLFYVEQMPAPQIAEVMGRSWVSVKTILFRARRKLAPFLLDTDENSSPTEFFPERVAAYV